MWFWAAQSGWQQCFLRFCVLNPEMASLCTFNMWITRSQWQGRFKIDQLEGEFSTYQANCMEILSSAVLLVVLNNLYCPYFKPWNPLNHSNFTVRIFSTLPRTSLYTFIHSRISKLNLQNFTTINPVNSSNSLVISSRAFLSEELFPLCPTTLLFYSLVHQCLF